VIDHVINPENVLDKDPMVLHGLLVAFMVQIKPHVLMLTLQPANLVNLNLMHLDHIKVTEEPHVDTIAVHHPQLVVAMVIKGEPHGNRVNPRDIKVGNHAKKENLRITKEKDQVIKAEITLLKSVILNFIF
jgi:hypothetical protein